MLSSAEAITLLVAAQGNAALAAARAQTELGLKDVTEPLLLATIAADPNSPAILYRQLQLLMVLQTFDALRKTHKTYLEKLHMLSPDGVARSYSQLLRNMSDFTAGAQAAQMPDAWRLLLSRLPAEVAEAVESLIVGPTEAPEKGEPNMRALTAPDLPPAEGNTPDPAVNSEIEPVLQEQAA